MDLELFNVLHDLKWTLKTYRRAFFYLVFLWVLGKKRFFLSISYGIYLIAVDF